MSPVASASPPAATGQRGPWTILEVLKWTTARFTERGLPTPRLDAELLAAHALALVRVQLYAQFDRPLEAAELAVLRELVKRRQAGEPVAYITGKKEFWSLELLVDPRVLVPRPDTETAVEEALALLPADLPTDRPARIADVATGSGALALALAKERPRAEVMATDVSPDALAVAAANAARLGLAVTFRQGDLLAPLRELPPFDLVVANLPYIPTAALVALAPEVQREPRLALDGGADGLVIVRRLIADAGAVLVPGGALVLEIGEGQAAATAEACRAAGLCDVRIKRDLGGIERVVSGRRPAGTP